MKGFKMKAIGFAALGLVGACAACCAVPLALPWLSALAASGFTLLGLPHLQVGMGSAALLAVVAGSVVFGAVTWRSRQRRQCAAHQTSSPACAIQASDSGSACGCSKSAP